MKYDNRMQIIKLHIKNLAPEFNPQDHSFVNFVRAYMDTFSNHNALSAHGITVASNPLDAIEILEHYWHN